MNEARRQTPAYKILLELLELSVGPMPDTSSDLDVNFGRIGLNMMCARIAHGIANMEIPEGYTDKVLNRLEDIHQLALEEGNTSCATSVQLARTTIYTRE